MVAPSWLWVAFTLTGAAAQTARNAMQRELAGTLGTVGATHVRFLFGFPFGVLFLALVLIVGEHSIPRPGLVFWPWIFGGALAQVLGTALMLAAMRLRSFVVATAYLKTEPIQVAVFGLAFLGDRLTWPLAVAILVATIGMLLTSWKPGTQAAGSGLRPAVYGISAGGAFALAAIGYRGAILSLSDPNFVRASTFSMAVALTLQASLLSLYLWLYEPGVLTALLRAWRPSLFAGFMGALGSEFWFLAFSIATAASVRTLALVEVVFAQGITRVAFKQKTTAREGLGIVLIVIGAALLVWKH